MDRPEYSGFENEDEDLYKNVGTRQYVRWEVYREKTVFSGPGDCSVLSLTPLAFAGNTDTISNWNIRISVPEGKTAVLKGSEYYIYGQHEGSIPYVMLRTYRYDNAEKFITDFTQYMQQQYSDLRIPSAAEKKTIGNKRCYEIDYGYTVSGYDVKDRRVIITTGETTYMFASKEIVSNGMVIGNMLDNVVADCELLGPEAKASSWILSSCLSLD